MSQSCTTSGNASVTAIPAGFRLVKEGPGDFRLLGELDLAAAGEIRAALLGGDRDGDVALDCSGLTFIDAAGLGLFVAVHAERESRGEKLVIVNASRCVTRLMEITDLDTLLAVHAEDLSAP